EGKLGRHSQGSHISSCKGFAAFLKRSPDTATADDIRRFQLYLAESGISICNRNRIMTGVRNTASSMHFLRVKRAIRCGRHAKSWKLHSHGPASQSGLLGWPPPRATPLSSNPDLSKRAPARR